MKTTIHVIKNMKYPLFHKISDQYDSQEVVLHEHIKFEIVWKLTSTNNNLIILSSRAFNNPQ